jgi:DNA-directed RNA polymerase
MSYMEALGKSLGSPLVWLSPSGFPVVQDYKKTKTRQVKSLLFGRIRSFNYNAETGDVDTAKMGRAFVPNFIHSLDASVLHIALSRTKASSVASVHDSFSTHACDMDELLQTLRDTNADVFSADPKVFWKKFFSLKTPEKQVLEDTVDSFSSMFGKLNVDGVRESAYMYR